MKESDRVGSASAYPDAKPDGVFSLNLLPAPTTIREISIAATNPAGSWSTAPKGRGAHFLGVARAKVPSEIVNRAGGPLHINPNEDTDLLLFITEDGKLTQKARAFTVRVVYGDGTSWTGSASAEPAAPAERPSQAGGIYPVRMSAVLKGISNFDAVGPSKKIEGDDKADTLFVLNIEAEDKIVTAIEVRNVDGTDSIWDTVPKSPNPAVGVALVSDPIRLLNSRDSSVRVEVKGRVDLNLYVADNGSITGGKTSYRVTVSFSDGQISWCPVDREGAAGVAEKLEPVKPRANFLGEWLGFVTTDAVGPYAELKPDGKADAVFGLDIETFPKTTITGIEIATLDGTTHRWSTTGTPGAWGLGVAFQEYPKALVNKPDGSIRVPLDKRSQFYLYAADPGDLASTGQTLRMIVYLSDGSAFQQFVRRPLSPTSSVIPGADEPAKAVGIMTCEFRGFIADLVDTSTRPRKDGYLDGTFIMKLQVEDKKLAKVEIASGDGVVHWSSAPRAPQMFLGVALYPKIYVLINPSGGVLQVPISGRRTLWLYAADNGMLSEPKTKLIATVTFADNTALSTEVIK